MNGDTWKGALAVGAFLGGLFGYRLGKNDACDQMEKGITNIRETPLLNDVTKFAKGFMDSIDNKQEFLNNVGKSIGSIFNK